MGLLTLYSECTGKLRLSSGPDQGDRIRNESSDELILGLSKRSPLAKSLL